MASLKPRQRPEPTKKSGWSEVKEILGNFLLILFGTWLVARLVAFWLDGWIATGEPTRAWLALQITVAFTMIALGIDRWRTHSRAK